MTVKASKGHKPKDIQLYDGSASCVPEEYDDMGGGAFGVQIDDGFLYDSKNVRRLINWLVKAEAWMKRKEARND